MAIFNQWIGDVLLCLLLPLFVSASDGYEDGRICYDDNVIRTSQYMTYYGCYNLSCFDPGTYASVNDIDQCTDKCKSGSQSYAALLNGYCSCGKFTCGKADTVCEFKCGVPCRSVNIREVLQTCGGIYYFQLYRDKTSDETLEETSGLNATPIIVSVLVLFVITVAGVITVCCILRAVRSRAQAANTGPSQAVNQLVDGDYTELRPVGSRNEATTDPSGGYSLLDLNKKPEISGSDEYHEYADANNLTRSESSLRIGGDGNQVPESFSHNTGSTVFYSTSIKKTGNREENVEIDDETEYIDFE